MIKATGRDANGNPLLVLGISGENVTRLLADEPIQFDTAEVGLPPMTVVIVYGKTEPDIVRTLKLRVVE